MKPANQMSSWSLEWVGQCEDHIGYVVLLHGAYLNQGCPNYVARRVILCSPRVSVPQVASLMFILKYTPDLNSDCSKTTVEKSSS